MPTPQKAEILQQELEADLTPIKVEAERIKSIVEQHAKDLQEAKGQKPLPGWKVGSRTLPSKSPPIRCKPTGSLTANPATRFWRRT